MSAQKPQYYDAWSTAEPTKQANHVARYAVSGYGPTLRYSSPWPWVLALAISATMWAGIGWLIWKLV